MILLGRLYYYGGPVKRRYSPRRSMYDAERLAAELNTVCLRYNQAVMQYNRLYAQFNSCPDGNYRKKLMSQMQRCQRDMSKMQTKIGTLNRRLNGDFYY